MAFYCLGLSVPIEDQSREMLYTHGSYQRLSHASPIGILFCRSMSIISALRFPIVLVNVQVESCSYNYHMFHLINVFWTSCVWWLPIMRGLSNIVVY